MIKVGLIVGSKIATETKEKDADRQAKVIESMSKIFSDQESKKYL